MDYLNYNAGAPPYLGISEWCQGQMDENYKTSKSSLLSQLNIDGHISIDLCKGSLQNKGQGFGLVHLGESMTLILQLTNESNLSFADMAFHLELQTSTQRTSLLTKESLQCPTLESLEYEIPLEVKELGAHVLSCSVSMKGLSDSSPKLCRRFFKFNVVSPFQLKTKVNEAMGDRVFVEAQLINVSPAMATFSPEEVKFDPSEDYKVGIIRTADISNSLDAMSLDENSGNYRLLTTLKPRCSYLFVFQLQTFSSESIPKEDLGKLDIRWRIPESGDYGRLQTGQIKRKPVVVDTVGLECRPKGQLKLNEAQGLVFTLKNNSPRIISNIRIGIDEEACFNVESLCSMVPSGIAQCDLPELLPGESRRLELCVIPVQCGMVTCKDFWLQFTDNEVSHRYPREFQFFILYETV